MKFVFELCFLCTKFSIIPKFHIMIAGPYRVRSCDWLWFHFFILTNLSELERINLDAIKQSIEDQLRSQAEAHLDKETFGVRPTDEPN